MIIESILNAIMVVVTTIFNILPDLPAMPAEIVSGGAWVVSAVANVSGLFAWLYGQSLYIAIIAMAIALINFEHLYHATLWVIRKLPLNIK